MKSKSNSYSIIEFIGKIVSGIQYIFSFFSNRKKKKQAEIDLKKIREYEGSVDDLQNSYKKIDKKKNKKKKQKIEKRLNKMF